MPSRAPSDFASLPPEAWLIRRVESERDGLARLQAEVVALESEPTTWNAPSRTAYLQRLGWEMNSAGPLWQRMHWCRPFTTTRIICGVPSCLAHEKRRSFGVNH